MTAITATSYSAAAAALAAQQQALDTEASAESAATEQAGAVRRENPLLPQRSLSEQIRERTAGTSTAVSNPVLITPSVMGNLSPSDLLQLIRDEARKSTLAVVQATIAVIKSMQDTIQTRLDEKITKFNDIMAQNEKADSLKKKMDILKYIMYGLAALVLIASVIAIPFTGGTSAAVASAVVGAMLSGALLTATICCNEIKDADGKSQMDRWMEDLTAVITEWIGKLIADPPDWLLKLLAVFGEKPDPGADADQIGAYTAMAAMLAIQVAIAAAIMVISGSAGGLADVIQGASNVTGAGANASAAATSMVDRVASIVVTLGKMATGATKIASATFSIMKSELEFEIAKDQADLDKLKAMIKFLQNLVQAEAEFAQVLNEVDAELQRQSMAIYRNESQTNKMIQQEGWAI
jgi:hypothetical protein